MNETKRRNYLEYQFNKLNIQLENVAELRRQYEENVLDQHEFKPNFDSWEDGETGYKIGRSIIDFVFYEKPLKNAEDKLDRIQNKYNRIENIFIEMVYEEAELNQKKISKNEGGKDDN
jgi:hypothetical protein